MRLDPFRAFCGYYLGLDRDFHYRFFNLDQLAAHWGLDPRELRNLLEQWHLAPEVARHVDYNLARAHAEAQGLADEGRIEEVRQFARRTFEEFLQALQRYDPSRDFENVDYDHIFPDDPAPDGNR